MLTAVNSIGTQWVGVGVSLVFGISPCVIAALFSELIICHADCGGVELASTSTQTPGPTHLDLSYRPHLLVFEVECLQVFNPDIES